jgi:hypothetical protein
MSEIAKQIKAIVDLGLVPLLKRAGFRKHGTHYARTKYEALQLVNIQSSQFNMGSQGRFTLNIGVHFSSVARAMFGSDPMPVPPREHYCLLRRRVGMLLEEKVNHWWTVTPQTDVSAVAAELTSAWNDRVSPWLSSVETISGAASEIEERPDFLFANPWTAAAARLVLGEPVKAAELERKLLVALETQRDTSHPANLDLCTSRIEELNRWAIDRNLPGFAKS